MIEIEFNNANHSVIKQNWENWLDIGSDTGVVIGYDEKMGKGLLFLLELEKGLNITISDYTAKDDLIFINKAYSADNNAVFTLDYLVLGDVYIVKNKQEDKKYSILNNVVSHHGKSDFSFVAPKGKRAKVLDVVFSYEWLLNQFSPSQNQVVIAGISKIESGHSFYINPVSSKSFDFIREVLDMVLYHEWNFAFLKSRIIFLIEDFVKTYILSKSNEYQKTGNSTKLPMMDVKQKINTTLYEKLPNRKALAKEFLMSESTLARQFKKSFGKTITEYHLEEKMGLASRILKRNEYTISQIAYLLGYETVSAFIKSFKSHFGVPPGLFRKRNID